MKELTPLYLRFAGCLAAILILVGMAVTPVGAQNPYPGWAAPKRIPTKSTRATFPDIAVDGDTIHVIFRATYTFVADDQGIPPEELILDEIQLITELLRRNYQVQIDSLGGEARLRKRKQELFKQLEQLKTRVDLTQTQSASPVQTAIYYTRSEDRGKTFWEEPIPIIAENEVFYGQTALHIDSRGLYVAFTAEAGDNIIHTLATHSEDGGKTWSRPEQLSTSEYNCFDPQLAGIPGGGVILTWWEKEATETEGRTRSTFEGMNEALSDGLIKTDQRSAERSLIKYSRRVGGTWQTEKFLADTSQLVPYVGLTAGSEQQILIHWIGRYGPEGRISRDGGVTWETTLSFSQVYDDQRSNIILYGGGDYHFIQGEPQLRKSTSLSHRKGLLEGEWSNIIDPQAQYSFPRLAYTKDELQVVWGTTDNLSGQSILYFREDNKPPTSELIYPVDGAFTKPVLVFLWDAVDDIATRMTYRWTIMKRENRDDKPEPHNWFEYEAAKENPIDPLPDGYYTLFLQSKDFAGNEETEPTQFKFQTYYVPPKIEVEGKSLPPIEIETRNLEIRWNSEDNTPGESPPLIAYRLDGNPVTEFARRDSIKIRGLRQGWHQVQVFAKDENGNIYPFGDTVSVRVNLSLLLVWEQKPQKPQQDGVVFVNGNSVSLRWIVTDNTEDEGVNFFSSVRYIHEEETSDWIAPQIFTEYEFSGDGGNPLPEGPYTFQVIAQDEFGNQVFGDRQVGNLAGAYIDTAFTVDRTPPEVNFAELVTYNEETKVPTLTVVGKDNYTLDHNLKYQFRVITREEPDPPWSALDSSPSFTAGGNPIKWYSWGYVVEARAQDILGNVTTQVAEKNLIWYKRAPALLYSLIGVVGLGALAILYLVFSSMAEKRRQRKRQAAKREAAKQSSAGTLASAEVAGSGGPAAGDEDDLFEVSETSASETGASDDVFGSPMTPPVSTDFGSAETSTGFEDPFSTSETTVFDDPFADSPSVESKPEPSPAPPEDDSPLEIGGSAGEDEPPPLSIGDEEKPSTDDDLFGDSSPAPEESPPEEKEKPNWSSDEKVELDDKDLFDPLS